MLIKELKRIVAYTWRPVYLPAPARYDHLKTFKIFGFLIALSLLISMLTGAILAILGISPDNHVKDTLQYGVLFNFLIVALLGPLLEETGFRLSMKFSKQHFFLTGAVLSYFLVNMILGVKNYDFSNDMPFRMATALGSGAILQLLASRQEAWFSAVWETRFKLIYFLFTGAFMLAHSSNFKSLDWYLIPVVTLPQLMGALIYGYVRMNYGFRYGLTLHALHNGLPGLFLV